MDLIDTAPKYVYGAFEAKDLEDLLAAIHSIERLTEKSLKRPTDDEKKELAEAESTLFKTAISVLRRPKPDLAINYGKVILNKRSKRAARALHTELDKGADLFNEKKFDRALATFLKEIKQDAIDYAPAKTEETPPFPWELNGMETNEEGLAEKSGM